MAPLFVFVQRLTHGMGPHLLLAMHISNQQADAMSEMRCRNIRDEACVRTTTTLVLEMVGVVPGISSDDRRGSSALPILRANNRTGRASIRPCRYPHRFRQPGKHGIPLRIHRDPLLLRCRKTRREETPSQVWRRFISALFSWPIPFFALKNPLQAQSTAADEWLQFRAGPVNVRRVMDRDMD